MGKWVTHFYNEKNKGQPIPCLKVKHYRVYQPRDWTGDPQEVTCKKCLLILKNWGKL